MKIKGTVLLNSDHDSVLDVFDEMIQDFCDSGHMNKENREQVKRTLLSHHRHNQAFTGGLTRKKSTISEFFPQQHASSSSRRQSTFININGHSTSSTANNQEQSGLLRFNSDLSENNTTSRKNSSFLNSDQNLNRNQNRTLKVKTNHKLSVSDADLEKKKSSNINNVS